jgi:hypothetical protein
MQHEASRERTEHDVQVEQDGHGRQRHEPKHGQPYGGLAGGSEPARIRAAAGRCRGVAEPTGAWSAPRSAQIASTISDRPGTAAAQQDCHGERRAELPLRRGS